MVPREVPTALKAIALGRPQDYVRGWTNYKSTRGMSRWHDLVDWVGGYPFEVASPEMRSSTSSTPAGSRSNA